MRELEVFVSNPKLEAIRQSLIQDSNIQLLWTKEHSGGGGWMDNDNRFNLPANSNSKQFTIELASVGVKINSTFQGVAPEAF